MIFIVITNVTLYICISRDTFGGRSLQVQKYKVLLYIARKVMATPKNNTMTNQLMILFTLVVSGVLILSDKQMEGIVQILLSAANPAALPDADVTLKEEAASQSQPDIIAGYAALSSFLGYSVPTCVRMAKEGRFDAAVLDYGGTRKKMWDRNKLIEIARRKK